MRTAAALPAPLDDLFGALGRERVRWTLLRPRELLQLSEGDVDVLVEPAARGRVESLLASLGFVRMPIPGPDLHAAIHDRDAGRFVWMHVQTALPLAGAVFAAEEVLSTATPERPPQPADDWLLWILLLRALVDKGVLPQRHRPHVSALARRWRGGPPPLEALARRHGLDPAEIVALAAAEDWDGLLRHSVHRRPAPPPPSVRVRAWLGGLRHLRDRRGLSVAVVGPDGAGKTTLVQGLAASLPLPTRIQYMGLTGGRMRKAGALRVPGLVLSARLVILWARYLGAWLHRARGRIVLFERYVVDGAVPSGARLSLAGRMSRRLLWRACPMPDLLILLDASGTTLHERSGEYEPAVLETWRAAYGRLAKRVAALEVIDAEQPAQDVLREAEASIWRRYAEIRARTGRRQRR